VIKPIFSFYTKLGFAQFFTVLTKKREDFELFAQIVTLIEKK